MKKGKPNLKHGSRNSVVLDPFCSACGRYKGIGNCEEEDCGKKGSDMDLGERNVICGLCIRPASTFCSSCSKGYCEHHSKGSENSKLELFNQMIATCSICGKLVCENCWISNKEGLIRCINHEDDIFTRK